MSDDNLIGEDPPRNSRQRADALDTREAMRAAFIIAGAEAAGITLTLRDGEVWADYPNGLSPEAWASFENALFGSNYPAIAALIAKRGSVS